MSVFVAGHCPPSRRLRRPAKLVRRAILLLLPTIILFSAFMVYHHQAAADFGQSAVYVVQPGDSLWEIAQSHVPERMDIRAYIHQLRLLNQLEQSVIHTGQSLLLPTR